MHSFDRIRNAHAHLEAHLGAFLDAYSFAKRLETLRGLTPNKHDCAVWTKEPDRFKLDPTHLTAGLDTKNSMVRHRTNFTPISKSGVEKAKALVMVM